MTEWRPLLTACALVLVTGGCGGSGVAVADTDEPVLDDLPVGWSELPAPPDVRSSAANAWTGRELLVWGGYESNDGAAGDGSVFDARDRRWRAMASGALEGRVHAASAWTGSELLVWGGTDARFERPFADGAAYDPEADTWRALPEAPIGARAPLSVWTGEELLVWGTAVRVEPRPRDGAAYDPRSDSWRHIAEAPIELTDATAVWTGEEMVVFGAALHGGNFPETPTAIGAAYDPTTDTWRELPDSALSPQASTAAWAGGEVVAWDYLNGSASWDPLANQWRALPDVPLDAGECSPESAALGDTVLGDYCGLLTRYDAASRSWRGLAGRKSLGWTFELVAADPVFLLLGRDAETGEPRLLAYRPR